MKLKIFITLFFSILILRVFAQDGVNSFTRQNKELEYGVVQDLSFTHSACDRPWALNYSIGAFLLQSVSSRLKIGTGVEYQQLFINTTKLVARNPIYPTFLMEVDSQDKFKVVKIPVWLSYNLNYKLDAKVRYNFIFGYSLGHMLNAREKEYAHRLDGLRSDVHYGFFCIETNKRVSQNIKVSLGGHMEITDIYNKRYGVIHNLKIVLRVTRLYPTTTCSTI